MRRNDLSSLYAAACLSTLLITLSNAKVVPYLEPGFSFQFTGNGPNIGLPITAQCETVVLRWGRGGKTGKAPIAPYFLQVFSSSSSSPFVVSAGSGPTFEWQVPFAPQTQYQICMYDNFGISGGCSDIRTIVSSTTDNPSCQNLTSLPSLSASTTLDDRSRPITQAPVISQCNDFAVSPTTGSPPFTLTISPSRHPPVNITSSGRKDIPWRVALPEGFPFFASLTSSDGLYWSQGPFYVDGSGTSDCLSPSAIPKNTFTYSTVGSSVGSFVLGSLLGIGAMFWLARRRQRRMAATGARSPPNISKPTLIPEYNPNFRMAPPPPEQTLIQYPPPPVLNQPHSMPTTPERGNFLEQDPFGHATPPPSTLTHDTSSDSIQPFTELSSPTSSHFPLDVKRRSHLSQGATTTTGPSRTASLRSYTTYASTSFNGSAYASSRNSAAPLMPSASMSTRSSRASRLGRAPTYARRPPPSHLSASEVLMDGDSMIGVGDVEMPPQYMRSPAEQERTVAGGALF